MEKSTLQFNKEGLERNNVYALRALLQMYGIRRRPGNGKSGEKTRVEMLEEIRASDRYHEDLKNQTIEGQPRASSTIKLDGDPIIVPDKLLNPTRPASKPKKKKASMTEERKPKPFILNMGLQLPPIDPTPKKPPTPDSKPAEVSRLPGADQPEELPKKKRSTSKVDPKRSESHQFNTLSAPLKDPKKGWPIKSNLLKVEKVEGDGNCLFRALAWWQYGDEEAHRQVRKEVVEWVKQHPTASAKYPGDLNTTLAELVRPSFSQWVDKMKKDKVYGDDVAIRGAAGLYGVNIFVVSSINTPVESTTKRGYIKYFPVDIETAEVTWGIVQQWHEEEVQRHFDVLTPKDTRVPKSWNINWKQFYKLNK